MGRNPYSRAIGEISPLSIVPLVVAEKDLQSARSGLRIDRRERVDQRRGGAPEREASQPLQEGRVHRGRADLAEQVVGKRLAGPEVGKGRRQRLRRQRWGLLRPGGRS